jgi:hypothetical protein
LWVAALIGIWIVAGVGVLRHGPEVSLQDHLLSTEGLFAPLTFAGVLMSPLLIALLGVTLRQVFFRNRLAIWIADGNLNFLNFYGAVTFSKLPVGQIDHFYIGSIRLFQFTGIIAHMKDGGQRYIPTILLSDGKKLVLSRLTDALEF